MAAYGIAVIDVNKKLIILDQLKADDHHDFIMMCWSIANLYKEFEDRYGWYIQKGALVAQEAPISAGINAGKLNALGCYFYLRIGYFHEFKNIRTYHPIKLKSFHHKKSYKKQDTIDVVNNILKMFEENKYTIKIAKSRLKKKLEITDGEADAFMYAVTMYMRCRPEAKTTKDILEMFPRFSVFVSIEEGMKE